MQAIISENGDITLPDNYRWVNQGELRQKGDLFIYYQDWVEIDGEFGRRQSIKHELIRREN